jgi:general secretion pathway protein C
VAYFINSVISYFLPKITVEYVRYFPKKEFALVKLSDKFCKNKEVESFKSDVKVEIEDTFDELKSLKLKALFLEGANGFIIVEDNNEEIFINYGDSYKGFRLVKIFPQSVIFEKRAKKYVLKLPNSDMNIKVSKKIYNDTNKISKSKLLNLRKKYDLLYKEIALKPVKTKMGFGYEIIYLKDGSVLKNFGLKRGDVILQINSQSVEDSQLFGELLNNLDNLEYISITLLREHKEKELYYEIY